jgi:hypothetical protein
VFTVESIDGGGLRTASADYASDGSFSAGDFTAGADYAQRGGYIGQLNNPPVATNYMVNVSTNSTTKVAIGTLLGTVTDADGDAVTFVRVAGTSAQNGVVRRVGNWVIYQSPAGFNGSDSFIWVAQDSEGDRATGMVLAQVGPLSAPPQPTLNLISIVLDSAPGATDATLFFAGLPGETYLVQYTDSVTPPVTWTTLGMATTVGGVFQIVDPTAGIAPNRFYRATVQPQ